MPIIYLLDVFVCLFVMFLFCTLVSFIIFIAEIIQWFLALIPANELLIPAVVTFSAFALTIFLCLCTGVIYKKIRNVVIFTRIKECICRRKSTLHCNSKFYTATNVVVVSEHDRINKVSSTERRNYQQQGFLLLKFNPNDNKDLNWLESKVLRITKPLGFSSYLLIDIYQVIKVKDGWQVWFNWRKLPEYHWPGKYRRVSLVDFLGLRPGYNKIGN